MAAVLIALLGTAPNRPSDALAAVRLYADLPLASVRVRYPDRDGIADVPMLDDNPIVVLCRENYPTLRDAIARLIDEAAEPLAASGIASLVIGGATGTATAIVRFVVSGGEMQLHFNTERLGGGRVPDDLPPLRIERASVVNGGIFARLAELFAPATRPLDIEDPETAVPDDRVITETARPN